MGRTVDVNFNNFIDAAIVFDEPMFSKIKLDDTQDYALNLLKIVL